MYYETNEQQKKFGYPYRYSCYPWYQGKCQHDGIARIFNNTTEHDVCWQSFSVFPN